MRSVSIKQAAEYLDVTEQSLRKRAKAGSIPARLESEPGKRSYYTIPLWWIQRELGENGNGVAVLAATDAHAETPVVAPKLGRKPIDQTQDARLARTVLVREWQTWEANFRETGQKRRVAMAEFCESYNARQITLRHADLYEIIPTVSVASLYRWENGAKKSHKVAAQPEEDQQRDQIAGLKMPFSTSLTTEQMQYILELWLHQGQPPMRTVWHYLTAQPFGKGVSYDAVYRFLNNIEKYNSGVVALARGGNKIYDDQVGAYLERDWTQIEPDELWIADGHTLDVMVHNPRTGKAETVTLYAFMDGRSKDLVGFSLMWTNSTDTVLQALAMGLFLRGIPKHILFDNGKEVKNKRFCGENINDIRIDGILDQLGIQSHWAIVRNAKAKPIERKFLTLKNNFSRFMTGYKGGNPTEKPEQLKRQVKHPNGLLTIPELYQLLGRYFEFYGTSEHKGLLKDPFGRTPRQVYDSVPHKTLPLQTIRDLMRPAFVRTISRKGVELFGHSFYNEHEVSRYVGNGEKYIVRLNDWDLDSVEIWTRDNQFLFTAYRQDKLSPLAILTEAGREQISDGMSMVRRAKRRDREALAAFHKSAQKIEPRELLPIPSQTPGYTRFLYAQAEEAQSKPKPETSPPRRPEIPEKYRLFD